MCLSVASRKICSTIFPGTEVRLDRSVAPWIIISILLKKGRDIAFFPVPFTLSWLFSWEWLGNYISQLPQNSHTALPLGLATKMLLNSACSAKYFYLFLLSHPVSRGEMEEGWERTQPAQITWADQRDIPQNIRSRSEIKFDVEEEKGHFGFWGHCCLETEGY